MHANLELRRPQLPAVLAPIAQDRTFGGYECTDYCSGHAAGYKWAELSGITDPQECPAANLNSFQEGCIVYTEDPSRGADEDDDGEPIE
jgi:hypothetical protein